MAWLPHRLFRKLVRYIYYCGAATSPEAYSFEDDNRARGGRIRRSEVRRRHLIKWVLERVLERLFSYVL